MRISDWSSDVCSSDLSIDLARLVDRRGFTRYWVAEHHSSLGVTTSSPAMLLARLVGETKRIRLGAGGMMLPNFPPLVVAEQFGLLASMAPGRSELGVGPAPGSDMRPRRPFAGPTAQRREQYTT